MHRKTKRWGADNFKIKSKASYVKVWLQNVNEIPIGKQTLDFLYLTTTTKNLSDTLLAVPNSV